MSLRNGFWDDESALDTSQTTHPLADILVGGWQIRLEPIRATGTWPGLPDIDATDDSVANLREYAYAGGGHTQVLAADRAQPFHHRSAFVRFQPSKSTGYLTGPNPLAENWAGGPARR